MFKISLSQVKALPFDFEDEVKKYAAALEAHRTAVGEPAPSVIHPWVEAAVVRKQYPVEMSHQPVITYPNPETGELVTEPVGEPVKFIGSEKPDDFVPEYEIVDDTPPPPTLDERKMALVSHVAELAHKAVHVIEPPLKRNLFAFQLTDAQRAVDTLHNQVRSGAITQSDFELMVAPHRSAAAKHNERTDKVQAIYRKLAQAHADIHDLTDATIDEWKPPEF